MFVRVKKSGAYEYLQIVHNQRIDGVVRQQVVATLGRLDALRTSGQLDALLHSCAKFSDHVAVLDATRAEDFEPQDAVRLGPPLVFGRLWEELGLPQVLHTLLRGRKFEFSVERAVLMTVLHRLMVSGSDRAAERWCRGYALSGIENLELHHLYRAMGWLGEPLPAAEQSADQRLGPRCRKDLIEERLFARRRDLFTSLELVFFDTTSIYFEGEGGESLGQYGYSKDHHPDLKQMVVGAVLDNTGRPLCCFLLPGNTADITTLIPVIDQLKDRFGIHDVCVVARFDGKWVLRTNTDLGPADVALKYKDLLLVESLFRNVKSILETRPIYHKCDDTIRGHVFCSFLALLLMKELQLRLEKQGHAVEWRRLLDDLEALEELTVTTGGKTFVVRTATRGDAGKALQAVGVGLGPKIRRA
jgi:hypothetical protein